MGVVREGDPQGRHEGHPLGGAEIEAGGNIGDFRIQGIEDVPLDGKLATEVIQHRLVDVHDAGDQDLLDPLAADVRDEVLEGPFHLAGQSLQGRLEHLEDILLGQSRVDQFVGGGADAHPVNDAAGLVEGEDLDAGGSARIGAALVVEGLHERLDHAPDTRFDAPGHDEISLGVDVDAGEFVADEEAGDGSLAGGKPSRAKDVLDGKGRDDQAVQGNLGLAEQLPRLFHFPAGNGVGHDGELGDPLLDDLALEFEIKDELLVIEGEFLAHPPVDGVFDLLFRDLGDSEMADLDVGGGHDEPDAAVVFRRAAELRQLIPQKSGVFRRAPRQAEGIGHLAGIQELPLPVGGANRLDEPDELVTGIDADIHGAGPLLLRGKRHHGLFRRLGRERRWRRRLVLLILDDVEEFFRGGDIVVPGQGMPS